MLSLDSETTGLDFHHGTKPYFVTTCDEKGNQRYWEWEVNPITRDPEVPPTDLAELRDLVLDPSSHLVLQNTKFDVTALATLDPVFGEQWPWERTEDTLIAGHLLASNQPHGLDDMALHYLGVDILPYTEALHQACLKARRLARSQFPSWRIAKKDEADMPSARDKTWQHDGWLPRALAQELSYPDDHPWWTVLRDYANTDSAATIALWPVMLEKIRERGLEAIYRERMKVLPVAY